MGQRSNAMEIGVERQVLLNRKNSFHRMMAFEAFVIFLNKLEKMLLYARRE